MKVRIPEFRENFRGRWSVSYDCGSYGSIRIYNCESLQEIVDDFLEKFMGSSNPWVDMISDLEYENRGLGDEVRDLEDEVEDLIEENRQWKCEIQEKNEEILELQRKVEDIEGQQDM